MQVSECQDQYQWIRMIPKSESNETVILLDGPEVSLFIRKLVI